MGQQAHKNGGLWSALWIARQRQYLVLKALHYCWCITKKMGCPQSRLHHSAKVVLIAYHGDEVTRKHVPTGSAVHRGLADTSRITGEQTSGTSARSEQQRRGDSRALTPRDHPPKL